MFTLINDLNTTFNKLKTKIPITDPSIPILYFGDYEAYNKSSIKIITVGLNPSHKARAEDEENISYKIYLDEYVGSEIFKNTYLMKKSDSHIVLNPLLITRY